MSRRRSVAHRRRGWLRHCWRAGGAHASAQPAPKSPRQKPPQQPRPPPPPAPAASEDADVAYGAFQRGLYLTAFQEATRRVDEKSDPKAMTLLGELYADGLGVPNDDKKAADWYRLAAARGDREAMFALAMFKTDRPRRPAATAPEAARLLADAAKLGHVVAAYDLGAALSRRPDAVRRTSPAPPS